MGKSQTSWLWMLRGSEANCGWVLQGWLEVGSGSGRPWMGSQEAIYKERRDQQSAEVPLATGFSHVPVSG